MNRQLIYNFPEELFADAGVLAVEHADFDGIEVRRFVLFLLVFFLEGERERELFFLPLEEKKEREKNSTLSPSFSYVFF